MKNESVKNGSRSTVLVVLHHDDGNLATSGIGLNVTKAGRTLHIHLLKNSPNPERVDLAGNSSEFGVVGQYGDAAFGVDIAGCLQSEGK